MNLLRNVWMFSNAWSIQTAANKLPRIHKNHHFKIYEKIKKLTLPNVMDKCTNRSCVQLILKEIGFFQFPNRCRFVCNIESVCFYGRGNFFVHRSLDDDFSFAFRHIALKQPRFANVIALKHSSMAFWFFNFGIRPILRTLPKQPHRSSQLYTVRNAFKLFQWLNCTSSAFQTHRSRLISGIKMKWKK